MATARRAGVGAIAFVVLTAVGLILLSPPGGQYDEKNIRDYLADGHRVSGIIGVYVGWLAVGSLLPLLHELRRRLAAATSDDLAPRAFAGLGTVAVAAMAGGWAVSAAPLVARAVGGSAVSVPAPVVFLVSEAGLALLFGAGFAFLGAALLCVAASRALPAWLRVATAVGGLGAIFALAWFPTFLLVLWGLVAGGWLLTPGATQLPAGSAGAAVPAQAGAPRPTVSR